MEQLCKTVFSKIKERISAIVVHEEGEFVPHDELIYVAKGSKIVPKSYL